MGPINNIPALVQIMACRRPGDKPLSGLMMVSLLTHICVTRPQWDKALSNLTITLTVSSKHAVVPHRSKMRAKCTCFCESQVHLFVNNIEIFLLSFFPHFSSKPVGCICAWHYLFTVFISLHHPAQIIDSRSTISITWFNLIRTLYRQISNIRRTLVENKITDHSDVVGASPVGAAPTTSSWWTQHLASMDWTKTTTRRNEKHFSFDILVRLISEIWR